MSQPYTPVPLFPLSPLPPLFKYSLNTLSRLRIVLEHATTAAALAAVARCGPSVAATVTAHHLWLTIDAVAGDPVNFCKPVAKMPGDRAALLRAVVGDGKGGGRVFFGKCSSFLFFLPSSSFASF